jgi:hypothetical protein
VLFVSPGRPRPSAVSGRVRIMYTFSSPLDTILKSTVSNRADCL